MTAAGSVDHVTRVGAPGGGGPSNSVGGGLKGPDVTKTPLGVSIYTSDAGICSDIKTKLAN